MSIDPVVRRARPADAAALADLQAEARSSIIDARGGAALLAERPAVGDWQSVFDDPLKAVWVAVVDEVVVGYCELWSPTVGGASLVRQVYVHPEARELGFGDELLAAAIAQARHVGADSIEAVALPGDRDTKNLFERAGLTARLITVAKRLGA